jgi:hypothetical protein
LSIEKTMTVLLVHGEGGRDYVNTLQRHRNAVELSAFARSNPGQPLPAHLTAEPDEPPDVMVVLVDPENPRRKVEWPVVTWDEVALWQQLAGWDPVKRHWQHGAQVTLTIAGPAPAAAQP